MNMNELDKKRFMWGVATSSYQIEGAYDTDGRGPSVWDTFSHKKGNVKNNDNGDTACNHYNFWEKDIELIKKLGVNSYRFSLSWPRIFPKGTEKKVNQKGIDFYQTLIDTLLSKGIDPVLTLNHWDMPQGLEDIGGWTSRNVVEEFTRYAYYISKHFGDRVKNWITHNEPWCISHLGYVQGIKPPGLKNAWGKSILVAHNLLLSHGLAIPEIRNNSKNAKVGITLNLNTAEPASESKYDKEECHFYDLQFNKLYLEPLYNKKYPKELFKELKNRKLINDNELSFINNDDLKIISTSTDFLGVNYYSRAVIRDNDISENENDQPLVELGEKTDFDWEVYPEGLFNLLLQLKENYNVNEIVITENGCSYNDSPNGDLEIKDQRRIDYHQSHIDQMFKAIEEGVNCTGYFAWSLMDNFEWAQGYSQRFGLIWVDFKTLERIPKNSFYWYQKLISSVEN